ncbi:hypothetical protein HOA92_02375 [archaeon]|jgi:hypothetical protein|nr:hypothetical protein [archaeon]MBT6761861.1 hypothetical protein [archaeon]
MVQISGFNALTRQTQINALARDFGLFSKEELLQNRILRLLERKDKNSTSDAFLQELNSEYMIRTGFKVRHRYSDAECKHVMKQFLGGDHRYASDVMMIAQAVKRMFTATEGRFSEYSLVEVISESKRIAEAYSLKPYKAEIRNVAKYKQFAALYMSGDYECISYAAKVIATPFDDNIEAKILEAKETACKDYVSQLLIGRDVGDRRLIKMQLVTPHSYDLDLLYSEFEDPEHKFEGLRMVWDRNTMSN